MRFFLAAPFLLVAFVLGGIASVAVLAAWACGRLAKAISGE